MTTLNKVKLHKPNVQAISIEGGFYDNTAFTFCENCENNIEQFSWYDEDCGTRYSSWFISGMNPNTTKECVA